MVGIIVNKITQVHSVPSIRCMHLTEEHIHRSMSTPFFIQPILTHPFRHLPKSLPFQRPPTRSFHLSPMSCHAFSSLAKIEWLPDPIVVSGKVQRGFGRGSRDLGTPTANLPGSLLDGVPQAQRDGVYFGFGRVPKFGPDVVKMVANIGRNITYGDVEERVLEAYLMSDLFDEEFYGEEMRLCIIGFLRPELKFESLEELISHINCDVSVSKAALDMPKAFPFRSHSSFLTP